MISFHTRHLALAALPAVRIHDLRHTHASLLVAAGVHPKAIQARMGHASITTTVNTYGHLMPSALAGVGSGSMLCLLRPLEPRPGTRRRWRLDQSESHGVAE